MARQQNNTDFIRVRGAREHNLKNVDVDIPRNALVVFTGVSGSGKSSLAFSTLYAEAQRRYLESVAPYARRLFQQMGIPKVDEITGLPVAVALQQQRGTPSTRSSVGSVTTLSNLLRMLYSRAGDYPKGQSILYAESFSPNTSEGACPACHGLGKVYEATEQSMVPDPSLSIRAKAIAAWPPAWQGQNLRDIVTTLGHDIDKPWQTLSKKVRDWLLFTEDQPTVPVYAGFSLKEAQAALKRNDPPSYMGTFTGARRYLFHTLANSQSALMKRRVLRYLVNEPCNQCSGKRLRRESLSIKFHELDIAEMSRLPLKRLAEIFRQYATGNCGTKNTEAHPETRAVVETISKDICGRLEVLLDLGLGYLSVDRESPTLSPGELQRLRLATQLHSNLFGVVYVLDEPSAGLHPEDTQSLLRAFNGLKDLGNSLFVVEHELDVIRSADWVVDIGPNAGEQGGEVLYSGPSAGLAQVKKSLTAFHLNTKFDQGKLFRRVPSKWLQLRGATRNNIQSVDIDIPLKVLTSVTGVSGSGKSSLVSQILVELLSDHLGDSAEFEENEEDITQDMPQPVVGHLLNGNAGITRLVQVDQKPIGRTPRSNLSTYTGLFDHVRKLFAATSAAKSRKYDAGRFSFNVAKGRCPTCEGEGYVMVELLFLPSVYAPCSSCHGSRFNERTLEIKYKGKSIADVLGLTVDLALEFFREDAAITRSLQVLHEVGLGYLRLGQPATELSGGETQRIKLATELQRAQRGHTLYILDEPTTGLHPSDVEKLIVQLNKLVALENTVIVVEHDMHVVASSDWIIDIGPGAGDDGGQIVAAGTPEEIVNSKHSKTASHLASFMLVGRGVYR